MRKEVEQLEKERDTVAQRYAVVRKEEFKGKIFIWD
jgi:hypothetical protein